MGARFRRILAVLSLAACGGGGGGGEPQVTVTLSGQISIAPALASLALLDREPNDTVAEARLEAPEGMVDAAKDPVDAFRVVARQAGTVTAELESEGVEGDVLLFDLATGTAARALDVREGDVFDIIVRARSGAGPYRAFLREGAGDVAPVAAPAGYCDCGDGFCPGEIVAAPAAGFDAEAAGLVCLKGDEGLCLLGDPLARDEETLAGLCDVLVRCARLEDLGLVRYAEPNRLRRLASLPDDTLFPQQWALPQVRANAVWDIATGTSVVVAIVDSGIRLHPDLEANLVPGYDFEADDADPNDPTQNLSHGTQVAGVIAAQGDNGFGVAGVLWTAQVMPLRAFDTAGFGTSFDIANAILYAAGLPNESGTVPAEPASVINLSFASMNATTAEEDACDQARAAGVFLCAATGNQGSASPHYPAAYDSVLGVGATTSSGQRATYSNFGNWLDLVAPGGASASDGVLSTGIVAGGAYGYPRVNGTSFASPHVAAVAALCRGLAPLTPAEVETILLSTAQDIGMTGDDQHTGHGIVDAYRAALAALGQTPPVYVPYEQIEVRLLRTNLTVVATATTSDALGFAWTMQDVPAGRFLLVAGTDRNHDGKIDGPGELYGEWSGGAPFDVDAPITGLDFAISE